MGIGEQSRKSGHILLRQWFAWREVLTDFIGDAELKAIMSDGYNAYTFIGNELKSENLKNTVHLVCLAHLRAKFQKVLEQGKDKNARVFLDVINRLGSTQLSEPLLDRVDCLYTGWSFPNR